jgi:large subunit ribosomal protein L29
MKASEMKTMSNEELEKKLTELKDELFHLRFQLAIKQLDNPHKITAVKRDIARVLTVINEGKKAAEKNA